MKPFSLLPSPDWLLRLFAFARGTIRHGYLAQVVRLKSFDKTSLRIQQYI
jgi:hypothetical protein